MIYEKILTALCSNCQVETSVLVKLYAVPDKFEIEQRCITCGQHDMALHLDTLVRLLDFSHLQLSRVISDGDEWRPAFSRHFEENPWIQQYMDAQGWWWICVCNGKVVGGSSNPQDFPPEDEKLKMAEDNGGGIPFCYAQAIVSEEV